LKRDGYLVKLKQKIVVMVHYVQPFPSWAGPEASIETQLERP
jgi:hypothetical protein